ncbi:MAG: two-component system response regulator [Geobacteraceae bacterium GWC2_48_7]|nr:MAG: two-component system response regulator [Geobacteraceae bacterium GWC2_48_7]
MSDLTQDITSGKLVLIIEDDSGFAELMSSSLEDEGFTSRSVTSGRFALELLCSISPDLIILDYTLSDMTGASLIEQIREQHRRIPFIMVTGRDDAGLAVQMMKSGACDFMLKDTSFLDRLPSVVARALQEAMTNERLRCAEESLRQSEMRLARAQKIARMGSWEWDIASNEIYLSDEMYRLLGFTSGHPSNIKFEWLFEHVDAHDVAPLREAFHRSVKTCKPFNITYRITTRTDGEIIVNSHGEVELDADGNARLISGTTLDITDRIRAESEIQQLINYDSLTGLPNRNMLHDRLRLAIAQAAREHHLVAVIFLDLDRFKGINDTLGHRAGDKLLTTVADKLTACVRESDTLARLGGDEFVIILTSMVHEDGITTVCKKILGLLAEPAFIEGHDIYTTASIGIAVYPVDGEDSHTLLKHADLAMYQAKEMDRNNFQFFSREMNVKVLEKMLLENSMRRALEREEFFLVYQPQVDARTGKITGAEALLRWEHPDLGLLAPDKFIYLAEENGFIVPIGEWVIQTACRQNKIWQDEGLPPIRMAVNLSGKQFGMQRLDQTISSILLETDLDPKWLELEITESAIMKNAEQNITTLQKFKEMGIALAIDDFGTGYSSLAYLKHFPISRLKIDRSFVRDISENPDDAAIAEIIIAMAQALKLNVIAEGVETRAQMELLSFHNCVEMQGYLFSRPVPAAEFALLLKNGLKY